MLDLIVCWVLARHVRRVADMKGQASSSLVLETVVTYFACEILGAVAGGLLIGDLVGIVVGAVGGATCAIIITLMRVNALPDERMVGRGPSSIGPQLVGSACVACGDKLVSVASAKKCEECGAPCHVDCFAQHVVRHPVRA